MCQIKIGIIGLGLMGGSLGLALKSLDRDYHIIGLDHNQSHLDEALKLKLVDEIVDDIKDIEKCNIIFLAIPVDAIIATTNNLQNISKDTTIIDLGSTKYKISNSIPPKIRENFVTAHPMAGTENFGPSSAFIGLYEDKTVVLCDLEKSGEKQRIIAKDIFHSIGMNIVYMDSKEHDIHTAYISHMPHALSYALANSVLNQEDPKNILALAGGGFRDMSRIAKSSANMWEDIFRQNRDNLIDALTHVSNELDYCKRLIEKDEYEELNQWMKKANILHKII
ncbi:Prephenate and/or arogenate dehydrogenase (unknown specificity) [hydrothermal vent metagenome]|uniref:Prephenate/arogenate dehydrogenase domain-containing protein n=1 Tax=hydrothermal vent metagenome TaxID=652676 RepID=A0A1W1EJM1_9ZZZZ